LRHSLQFVFWISAGPKSTVAVLKSIPPGMHPWIFFVTAYGQARALDLDYLLKPFDRERFDAALDRARLQLRQSECENRADRFIVRHGDRILSVPAQEIDCEAQGNYTMLHPRRRKHLLRESMANLRSRLDIRRFRRIHRSAIVNLDAVGELPSGFQGDYELILRDGTCLKLSHRYRRNLERNALGGL
jgi:two-component system LytT family response regulator